MKPRSPDLAGVLGHGSTDKRMHILRHIADGGSISEAARRAGVSYKAAWQAIETLGNLAGTPMVQKLVGGSGGGGAVITPAGLRVLQAAALLGQARADVLAALAPSAAGRRAAGGGAGGGAGVGFGGGLGVGFGGGASSSPGAGVANCGAPLGTSLAALALRTSMRNQFPCTVAALRATGGLLRVRLQLSGSGELHARITRESAQLLQLAPGLPVLALCKATAVRVAPHIGKAVARNVLVGSTVRASRSVHGGEATLQLAGGVSLVGFVDAGPVLKAGQPAMASIDEAGVVIAISG